MLLLGLAVSLVSLLQRTDLCTDQMIYGCCKRHTEIIGAITIINQFSVPLSLPFELYEIYHLEYYPCGTYMK